MSRVAVVTGARAASARRARRRWRRPATRSRPTYTATTKPRRSFHAETGVSVYKWDVGDYDACVAGLAEVATDLGPVDVLVNNAGIARDGMFHKMTPEQWYGVININLNSLFNMCRPVIEGMRERGFGRIVNISSINGQKGQMGQVNYSAAKAGDIGFTKALAQENAAKGITVNAICPGYIATEMVMAVPKDVLEKAILPQIPVRRLGEPEEDRPLRRLSRRRRSRLHHRLDPDRQRRAVHGVSGEAGFAFLRLSHDVTRGLDPRSPARRQLWLAASALILDARVNPRIKFGDAHDAELAPLQRLRVSAFHAASGSM